MSQKFSYHNSNRFRAPILPLAVEYSGPFRTADNSNSNLYLQRFSVLKNDLPKYVQEILKYLPKGMAIVGSFARGIYSNDFSSVGDLDLALKVNDNCLDAQDTDRQFHLLKEEILDFLKKMGLVVVDHGYYGFGVGYNNNLSAERYYTATRIFSKFQAKIPFMKWNCSKINFNKFRELFSIDIILCGEELEKLISFFDISITQFTYLDGYVYATPLALEDLSHNRFRLLCDTNYGRIAKYIGKGFDYVPGEFNEIEDLAIED